MSSPELFPFDCASPFCSLHWRLSKYFIVHVEFCMHQLDSSYFLDIIYSCPFKYFHLCLGHNTATKTKLEDHIYRVGLASQVSDYVRITRFIFSHIKEKYTKGGTEIA